MAASKNGEAKSEKVETGKGSEKKFNVLALKDKISKIFMSTEFDLVNRTKLIREYTIPLFDGEPNK